MASRGGDITAQKLKNVPLPNEIKCAMCKKVKKQNHYSKRQLNDLAYKVSQNGKMPFHNGNIKCRICTGAQVTELECCMCEEVKGLDAFSRAQRRDPDNARCLRCVRVHEQTEPEFAPLDDPDEMYSDSDDTLSNPYQSEHDTGHGDDDDGVSSIAPSSTVNQLAASTAGMSITGHENIHPGDITSTHGGFESQSHVASSVGGGDSINPEDDGWVTQSRKGRSSRAGPGVPFTGFDASGQAHPRIRAPSSRMTASEAGPSVQHEDLVVRTNTKGGWVKIKNPKKTPSSSAYLGLHGDSKDSEHAKVPLEDDDDDEAEMPEW